MTSAASKAETKYSPRFASYEAPCGRGTPDLAIATQNDSGFRRCEPISDPCPVRDGSLAGIFRRERIGSALQAYLLRSAQLKQNPFWVAELTVVALTGYLSPGTRPGLNLYRPDYLQRTSVLLRSTDLPSSAPRAPPISVPATRLLPPSMTLPRMPPPTPPMIRPVVPSLRLQ